MPALGSSRKRTRGLPNKARATLSFLARGVANHTTHVPTARMPHASATAYVPTTVLHSRPLAPSLLRPSLAFSFYMFFHWSSPLFDFVSSSLLVSFALLSFFPSALLSCLSFALALFSQSLRLNLSTRVRILSLLLCLAVARLSFSPFESKRTTLRRSGARHKPRLSTRDSTSASARDASRGAAHVFMCATCHPSASPSAAGCSRARRKPDSLRRLPGKWAHVYLTAGRRLRG